MIGHMIWYNNCSREQLFTRTVVREWVGLDTADLSTFGVNPESALSFSVAL